MPKITAIIPTFNEENNIKEVLESVGFADELLVVDSFSTDQTLEIARQFPTRIIQREYQNSASQKNWAIPQATHEWILLVDADERVTPALRDEILQLIHQWSDTQPVAFWIGRINHFMGQQVRFSGWQNDKVIRLFRKDKCRYEEKKVHAEIIANGAVGKLQNKFLHFTFRSMDHYVEKINRYAAWQAQDYDQRTGFLTPYHFVLKPFWGFFKHFILKQGFRDGVVGFTIAKLQSYGIFMRYVNLWLLRKAKR